MKLPKWAAIALIASLLLNIKTGLDMASMKNEIRNLQGNVISINHSLQNTMSGSINRINEILKKETSLVNEFRYEYLDHKDKRVYYILTLKPRVYNEGERLSFLLKIGENNPELVPTETEDNVTFTAKVNMSIFDPADIDLVIEDEKSKKTEKLESIYPAVEKFAAQIRANPLGGSMRMGTHNGNSVLIMNYNYELNIESYYGGDSPVLSDVNLHVEVNNKIIDTMPMPRGEGGGYRHYINLTNYKIPCKANDNIIIYATAKDDKGFNYKCYMIGWTINSEGALDHSQDRYHFGEVEIY